MAAIVLMALVYVIINISFVESRSTEWGIRLKSGGQLPYSLLLSMIIGLSRPYSKNEAKIISQVLMLWGLGVTLYGTLETFSTFAVSVSDEFRVQVYSQESLYFADQRDVEYAGRIRPKVFTSEPSHAAWGAMAVTICSFALQKKLSARLLAIGIVFVSMIVFVSPGNLVGLLALLACYLYDSGRLSKSKLLLSLPAGAVLAYLAILWIPALFGTRFQSGALEEQDGSTFVRLIQPVLLAKSALEFNALLGVGFGGLEEIWQSIEVIDGGIESVKLAQSVGAAILSIPLFGGLTLTAMFGIFFVFVLRRISPEARFSFALTALYALSIKQSIVVTPAWFIIALWMVAQPSDAAGQGHSSPSTLRSEA